MTKFQSIYFDLIRFVAACMVVHSHLLEHELLPLWLSGSKEFGREAVIIFFVMSGYVIAYTTGEKKHNWQDYLVARAARIYSVAFPVIILAAIIGCIGINLTPEKYQDFYQYEKLYFYIPFHLLFLGETSIFYEKPFLVVPYWSLSYEVWYYVMFGCCFFIKGRLKYLILGLLMFLVGFRLLLLAPIWCAGVALFLFRDKLKLAEKLALPVLLLTILMFVGYAFSEIPNFLRIYAMESWPGNWAPLGSAERYLSDYIYTLIIGLNFIAVTSVNWKIDRFIKTIKIIRSVASYTFTLYLSHMLIIEPIIRHINAYQHKLSASLLALVGIILSTWLLGLVTEKRKNNFAKFFNKLLIIAGLQRSDAKENSVGKTYGSS